MRGSNPVAMREREHVSDHKLYIDLDGHRNREEERGWGWVTAISSLGTYTDTEAFFQQRVEPGVGKGGRGWVCSYDFIILKWEEWPR